MNDTKASAATLGVPTPRALTEPSVSLPAPSDAHEPRLARARAERIVLPALALLVAFVSVLVPIGASGLWVPYELDTAELARRIAVGLHGVERLALEGRDNRVPILSELGKGQLPFSSIAIGFQLFGLSDWAGRLPLALWTLLGLLCVYLLVQRLLDRAAASYTVIVLSTMPLCFLQGRTLLGDAVTLAASALATTGLALATFGAGKEGGGDALRGRGQALWALAGLVGLAAGFASRGVLIGVAGPALGVGLAWLFLRLSGARAHAGATAYGSASLTLGALALVAGVVVLLREVPAEYLEVLGSAHAEPRKFPSYESVLHRLGFALFPWSAVCPFAIAVALGRGRERPPLERALVVCALSVLSVTLGVHLLVAPYTGHVAFSGAFAIAVLVAIGLRDLESAGRSPSSAAVRLVALGIVSLLVVFCVDLRDTPGRSLNAFFLSEDAFPESFGDSAKRIVTYGSLACLVLLGFALGERARAAELGGSSEEAPPFAFRHPDSDYHRWAHLLTHARGGQVLSTLVALGVASLVLSIAFFVDARFTPVPALARLGPLRPLARFAFALVPLVVAAPFGVYLARDAARAFFARVRIGRVRFVLAALTAFALVMSLAFYPALASHLSPREAFATYRQLSAPGEPLAVLGNTSDVAAYYARGDVHRPASAAAAIEWLRAGDEPRWLVLGSQSLAEANSLYRQRTSPAENLPIVDGRSSEVLLASNRLLPGRSDENPLSAWITREPPPIAHPLDVELDGQLRCLGFSFHDRAGRPVSELESGQSYQLSIHWEVLTPVRGSWKTFVHIDGHGRRLNADHETLQGKYPFRFWRPGDFVTDVHTLQVEPQFAGGTYEVLFGLYAGKERMKVRRGAHHDNRIKAGTIRVL